MSVVDVLEPGRRLDPAASAEVAAVISTFNSTLDRLEGERRASMHRVLAAQEAERRRIAQELHDQIGQNLTAVVLELKRVRERAWTPARRRRWPTPRSWRARALEEVRRISYELRPAALDDLGLASALRVAVRGHRAARRDRGRVSPSPATSQSSTPRSSWRSTASRRRRSPTPLRHARLHAVRVVARPVGRRTCSCAWRRRRRHGRQLPGRRAARHARARGRGRRRRFETRSGEAAASRSRMRIPVAAAGG